MSGLDGAAIVITGGGTGIGREVARGAVAAGARVVLCGRREERLREACAELGEPAAYEVADLTRAGDPARVVAATLERFGRLDGLVNNAARFQRQPLADTSDEEIRVIYELNVIGLLAMVREAIPALRASQGSIVNVTSIVAQGVLPHSVPYAGSKAAVEHMTRALAVELGPARVRVNAVAPGLVETEMSAPLRSDPEALAQTVAATPLGRIAQPGDIAPVVLFLLSPQAGWVTGQIVQAAGGFLL